MNSQEKEYDGKRDGGTERDRAAEWRVKEDKNKKKRTLDTWNPPFKLLQITIHTN